MGGAAPTASFWRWSAYGTYGQAAKFCFLATNSMAAILILITFGYGAWLYMNRSQASPLFPFLFLTTSFFDSIMSCWRPASTWTCAES
jgi:hypothetical protein